MDVFTAAMLSMRPLEEWTCDEFKQMITHSTKSLTATHIAAIPEHCLLELYVRFTVRNCRLYLNSVSGKVHRIEAFCATAGADPERVV